MKLIKAIEKYPWISIICFTCIIMLPNLSGLWVNIMEARNFITAREMINDGNWLLTTLNGLPRYEKPPLPTFITAIFGWIFGLQNIFWLRFPTVIMVCTTGICSYLITEQFVSKSKALLSGFIAVSSFYILMICHEAPWDIYAHAFMLVAIVHLLKAFHSPHYKNIPIATIFIALSVLCKGPVSIYALLFPLLLSYASIYGIKNKLIIKTSVALVVGSIIGSIWFVYVRLADPEAFIKIVSAEASNWTSYEMKPFYYYWSFFLQSGMWIIPALISLIYPYLKNRVINKKAYQFSLLWIIFALLLLSIIPEKKSRYLVPVLIPLAINCSFYIEYLIRKFPNYLTKLEKVPAYFNFGGLGILGFIVPPIAYFVFIEQAQLVRIEFIVFTTIIYVISAILVVHIFYKKNMQTAFYTTLLFFAVCCALGFPMVLKFQNQNKAFASITMLRAEVLEQKLDIFIWDTISPEMLWDYGTKLPLIKNNGTTPLLPADDKFGLLVSNKEALLKSELTTDYHFVEKYTFNRNTLHESSRRHKDRNIIYYYILTKKQAID